MNRPGFYHTISNAAESRLEIKGSRFQALAFPLNSEEEVKNRLQSLQKKFSQATHICYAYRLGFQRNELTKTYDAGEPNFTAGKPILNAIVSQDLTNILVVVVRWFGGIKLGKANLARAYRKAAEKALQSAERLQKFITERLSFQIEMEKYKLVHAILIKHKAELQSKYFNNNCQVVALVPQVNLPGLKERLIEATSGKIKFK